jgi:hypothetical protein
MKLKVRIDFNDSERVHILNVASQLDMKVDEFCRRAVFYAINDAYRRAEEEAASGTYDTESTESSGDTGPEQPKQDAAGDTLPQS